MMSTEASYKGSSRIFITLGYIVVFVFGLYIGQGSSNDRIIRRYDENYLKFIRRVNKSSANVLDKTSFAYIGVKYQTDKVAGHHYDTMYEKYLPKYVGTNISILEIGLGCGMSYGPGASAYLWREYLGPRANIHFIEFNQQCGEEWYKAHGVKLNITMHYGSQDDIAFLNTVNTEHGYFDVIIDDGGHSMKQQITSFTYLLPKVRSGGIYAIEDLQTSYFNGPDTGYLVASTTIEFIKRLIDDVQVDSPRKVTPLGGAILSFEISNKICFFNKK